MIKVLIADDSIFMRRIMRKLLTSNNFLVVGEAENGKIAFEKYKQLLPDIVTMDITMDEMTGIEALQAIMGYDKNAKIVMVSAMGQEAFVRESILSGAKGFLVKPFKDNVVISTLLKVCE